MVSEETNAKTYMELARLEECLAEMDFRTQLIERSAEYEINVLLASIEPDYKNRERMVNFTFVPVGDDQLDYISLLQFYTNYPFELDNAYKDELIKLLCFLNTKMPMGCLSINKDNQVFFKYIYAIKKHEFLEKDSTQELVALFQYAMSIFAQPIEEVAIGTMTCAKALEDL
ncbi:hypothetical protein [Pseudanabaena minima]|uniref:hypothetical protein n=1 Tax=Pseudanabaena minima TaxID=890415 RepID=UPI003DA9E2EA